MTSNDGVTWTTIPVAQYGDLTAATYGNNIFVAVSTDNYIITSYNNNKYLYPYTVNPSDGTNYIDGKATVSLSGVTDLLGNPSQAPTNTTFTIDTVAPSAPVTSPVAGTYTGTQSVTLSSIGSDSLRYSTTEAPADCSAGTLYSTPIEVLLTSTIYAIACDNAGNFSSSTFDYIINNPVVITVPVVTTNHSSGGSSLALRNKFITDQNALILAQNNLTSPVISGLLSISRTLKLKITSPDVKELQKYLNSKGYLIAITGPGSVGHETNYFGPATKRAVILFQKANKLKGDGIAGKATISMMK